MHKTRASRAQIFQSFDALKGFREILKEKERVIVPKKILSEDNLAELDYKVIISHKNEPSFRTLCTTVSD